MSTVVTIIAVAVGLAVGSFLNVCIDRLPQKASLVSGRSHCDSCGRQLTPAELVPVASYLLLKGRCRTCGARIPLRIVLVEAATGALFGVLFAIYGATAVSAVLAIYGCILLVVFVIDLDHKLILNVVVYPSSILALLVAAVILPPWLGAVGPIPLVNALLGAVTGFGLLFVIALVAKGGMGWGDVKFAAFMGAATGFPLVIVALFVGIVVGGLVGVLLLVTGKKARKQGIPFGPFLAIGTMAAMLWGQQMLSWYLGMM